jgi:hypothetical protein
VRDQPSYVLAQFCPEANLLQSLNLQDLEVRHFPFTRVGRLDLLPGSFLLQRRQGPGGGDTGESSEGGR